MGTAAYSGIYPIFNIFSTYAVYRLMKVFLGEPAGDSRYVFQRYALYFFADTIAWLTFDRAAF